MQDVHSCCGNVTVESQETLRAAFTPTQHKKKSPLCTVKVPCPLSLAAKSWFQPPCDSIFRLKNSEASDSGGSNTRVDLWFPPETVQTETNPCKQHVSCKCVLSVSSLCFGGFNHVHVEPLGSCVLAKLGARGHRPETFDPRNRAKLCSKKKEKKNQSQTEGMRKSLERRQSETGRGETTWQQLCEDQTRV